MSLTFYHYEVKSFNSSNASFLNSILSDINVSAPILKQIGQEVNIFLSVFLYLYHLSHLGILLENNFFLKKCIYREFPGSPVVRTLCFHCLGPRVKSLVRELRSHKLPGAAR